MYVIIIINQSNGQNYALEFRSRIMKCSLDILYEDGVDSK